tara:strand:- start:2265 stop:3287 length:1023 start_codon:yes stop_codon:yes gene_type:complete
MKVIILRIAKTLGLFVISSWLTRNRLRILGYHGIWFLDDHYGNHLFMSPEKFHSRMTWLKNSKYHVISLDSALRGLKTGKGMPYSTVITIDDGWFGTFRYMLPVLQQENMGATLYVYTGAVDKQEVMGNILIPALVQLSIIKSFYLNDFSASQPTQIDISSELKKQKEASELVDIWQELDEDQAKIFCREVAESLGFDFDLIVESRQFSFMSYDEISIANKNGLDIQLHTDTHHLDVRAPDKIVSEIKINREKLVSHVDSTLNHFCYPSGVNCNAMHPFLEECGIISATITETGLVKPLSNPYAMNRILDGEQVSQLEFEGEMSGFLELVRDLKRILFPS